jgi:hypothetical protein
MLKQLRIRNFRGFRNHVLPLRRTTLMVGRNNAGKSTVVEALRLLSVVTTRFRALGYHEGPDWGGIPKREYGVRPSLKGLEINFTALFHRYGEPPAVIDATFDNDTSVRIYVGGEDQVHAVVFDDSGHAVKTKAAALRLDLPVVEILPQIGPLDAVEVILNEEYVRRTDSSRLFSKHFRNQLRYFPDRIPPFKEIVEETWPGVQVKELRSPRSLPGEPLSLMVRNEDFVAEVASMGHGLQMWLQTMWFLAKVQGVSCVILDEPDVYMHPDLQRRLIGYLNRRHEQVIVATHSVEMMSEVGPEDVLIVDHRRNTSSFASDVTAVQRLVEHIGSVHNLQLARLWNARKCLLVEGRDMKLLSVVHRTLFPEAESLETVPHMEVGGWGGWPYAIGSSLLLRNSGGEKIAVYCILDRDFHSEETLAKRYAEADRNEVILHIWTRKEIENYFILPAAILRVISRRMPARTTAPTKEELLVQLDRICESLKDETFDAMAAEMLADNRALGAGGANRAARQLLVERWKTLDGKLNTVSGKRVFAELSQWAQEQFGASLSAGVVAREITAAEVEAELSEVIAAIELDRRFRGTFNKAMNSRAAGTAADGAEPARS